MVTAHKPHPISTLSVEYLARRGLNVGDSRFLTHWRVTVFTDPELTRPKGSRREVGWLGLTTCDFLRVPYDDAFVVLDSIDYELGAIAGELLVHGRARFETLLDSWDVDWGLALLTSVEVAPEYRGTGLGGLLISEAMARLCRGWGAVAVRPGPLPSSLPANPTKECVDNAVRALTRMYKRLGFSRQFNDVLVCDPNSERFFKAHARLRKRLGLWMD